MLNHLLTYLAVGARRIEAEAKQLLLDIWVNFVVQPVREGDEADARALY